MLFRKENYNSIVTLKVNSNLNTNKCSVSVTTSSCLINATCFNIFDT